MLSKESIDVYLEKFGPEASIEIVVVGGAAINYTFRESTMDIDTFSRASAYLDDLVADVAKECSLPTDWMNHNVMVTGSFTPAIAQYAKHYKTFKGVLKVFTADALTLICMKSERFVTFYGGWDMLPPSLRVGVEDKYEVLQGGVTVSEDSKSTQHYT